MSAYPTTKLDRAIDSAIAQENARAREGHCPACHGLGRFYRPPTDGTTRWTYHRCDYCGSSGEQS